MTIGVLIADDQALVRAGFRMILETDADLRVVAEADDGAQAVEAVRRTRPDIVLMDIRMPVMDGLAAAQAMSVHARASKVPILVVTAKQVTVEERATLNGYVTAIMAKGTFDRGRLRGEIRRAIGGRRVDA